MKFRRRRRFVSVFRSDLPLLAHPASPLLSPSDLLQQNVDRRERLRRLALETIDITKDPYFMRNHLGQYECRLCLTVHKNEGNYLAHTQGRRHQGSLAKRAAREAERSQGSSATAPRPASVPVKKGGVKIGRPGYRVTKQFDPERNQRSLLFQIEYPEISGGSEPRHRFMSCFEQRKEAPDRAWQYVLFAAEPYETIAFKVPNAEVERGDAFFVHWDSDAKIFSVQLPFRPGAKVAASGGFGAGGSNRAADDAPSSSSSATAAAGNDASGNDALRRAPASGDAPADAHDDELSSAAAVRRRGRRGGGLRRRWRRVPWASSASEVVRERERERERER